MVAPPGRLGNAIGRRIRTRIEEVPGLPKTVGGFRRTRYRGLGRTTQLAGSMVAAADNLVHTTRRLVQPLAA